MLLQTYWLKQGREITWNPYCLLIVYKSQQSEPEMSEMCWKTSKVGLLGVQRQVGEWLPEFKPIVVWILKLNVFNRIVLDEYDVKLVLTEHQ